MQERLGKLIEKIEAARLKYSAHHIIKLVAVSKYANLAQILDLYNAGQRAFGENKVQDLRFKSQGAENLPLEWHFIGHLQENKINALLAIKPFLFQSLDSLKLATALQKRLENSSDFLNCLLQIKTACEENKTGFAPKNALESYAEIAQNCPNLRLKGIMTIATNSSDSREVEACFKAARAIFEKIPNAEILSMGMSSDYEIAIGNGANMLRIGSEIFNSAR